MGEITTVNLGYPATMCIRISLISSHYLTVYDRLCFIHFHLKILLKTKWLNSLLINGGSFPSKFFTDNLYSKKVAMSK